MAKIKIYTSPFCGYCHQAKALLNAKNVAFEEIDVVTHPGRRQEMAGLTGSRSVPQIFVDGELIGDCDTIHNLDAKGVLNPMLGIAG
jgi:glutaredoxin 3